MFIPLSLVMISFIIICLSEVRIAVQLCRADRFQAF